MSAVSIYKYNYVFLKKCVHLLCTKSDCTLRYWWTAIINALFVVKTFLYALSCEGEIVRKNEEYC